MVGHADAAGASIEMLEGAHLLPLTFLEPARAGANGTFDGGVYDSQGRAVEAGLQLKNSYDNVPTRHDPLSTVTSASGNHVFGGMLQNEHFGHFMAESLSRLWALRHLSKSYGSVVFYLRVPNRPVATFAREMLELVDPGREFWFVSTATSFERLAVPCQLVDPKIRFIYGHPAVRGMFAHLRPGRQSGPGKIYVSRSRLVQNEGGLLAEAVLERNLQAEGYTVLHPQDMSVREQIAAYASADTLVFAEGSALHLYALVARPDQRVFIVWRRKSNGVFAWQIRSFGGPAPMGAPCIERLWIPASDDGQTVRAQAALDFRRLREAMTAADLLPRALPWEMPTQAETEADLKRARHAAKCDLVSHPGF